MEVREGERENMSARGYERERRRGKERERNREGRRRQAWTERDGERGEGNAVRERQMGVSEGMERGGRDGEQEGRGEEEGEGGRDTQREVD